MNADAVHELIFVNGPKLIWLAFVLANVFVIIRVSENRGDHIEEGSRYDRQKTHCR